MEASAARAAVSVNHAIRTGDNLIRYRTAPQPAAFLLALSDGVSVGCHAGVRVTTLVDCRTEAPATPFQAIATELDEAALHDLAWFLNSASGGELGLWRNEYAHWWTLNRRGMLRSRAVGWSAPMRERSSPSPRISPSST